MYFINMTIRINSAPFLYIGDLIIAVGSAVIGASGETSIALILEALSSVSVEVSRCRRGLRVGLVLIPFKGELNGKAHMVCSALDMMRC